MERITQLQVYMFFSQFLFSTVIGFFISPLVKTAGFSAWISVIVGSCFGLFIAYLAYRLCMRAPDRSIAQYGPQILGKWFHYPLITLVIFASVFSAALILRQLVEFIVQIYLPDSPQWAVAALFSICIARGVRSGIVTIFRSAQGLFFFSVVTVVSFPLFVINEVDTDMAVALITNYDIPGIWNGAMMVAALFGEMAFIAYFFPYLTQHGKLMKAFRWAAATAVVVTLADLIQILLLFGPELTGNLTYPTLELIRYIRPGTFIENLDPLLIVFWLFSMFLKLCLFLLISVTTLTHTLGLKDHRPMTYSMATVMAGLSIFMFRSTAELEEATNHYETAILLFLDVTPILYLAVDWIRSLWAPAKQGG